MSDMRRIRPPFPEPGRPDSAGVPGRLRGPNRPDRGSPSLGGVLAVVSLAAFFAVSGELTPLSGRAAAAGDGVEEETLDPPGGARPEALPETDRYGRGAAYWRERARELRERVEATRERFDEAREAYADARRDDYPRGEALAEIEQRFEEARQELREAEAELEGLREEARRAGALPGWIRPGSQDRIRSRDRSGSQDRTRTHDRTRTEDRLRSQPPAREAP